jgi:hypothetical protein
MIAVLSSITMQGEIAKANGNKIIDPLPRELEIELALSALPKHLRNDATVYVLDPEKGFEMARKGTNGFHALVERTDDSAFRGSWDFTEYRDDLLIPISFDEIGARSHMPMIFDVAELQAKGMPAAELKKIALERVKNNYYKIPERTGISYMLSPVLRTYHNPDESDRVATVNMPHVMIYAPNVTNEDIGGNPANWRFPFVINSGSHGFIILAAGEKEKETINREYKEMLEKLCKLNKDWCLQKPKRG